MWFGFEHAYGAYVGDENGDDLGVCYRFTTKAELNQWVSESSATDPSQPGYRQVYSTSKARRRHMIIDHATGHVHILV